MTKIMTPSTEHNPMTDGQVNKAVKHYRDMLEKHREEIGDSDSVQKMLGSKEYLNEQLAVIRKRIELVSNTIIRHATVDRTKTPQEVIIATGRKQYTNRKVVDSMPRGEGEEVELHFFKPEPWEYDHDGYMSIQGLEAALERRGLVADPYAQITLNTTDSAFADKHPNGCQWNVEGNISSFLSFDGWGDERRVDVGRDDGDWGGDWWFAGCRKPRLRRGK